MATNIKQLASGIVLALVGVMIAFILFNSLFSPTNTSVDDLNSTLSDAGYTSEATIVRTSWKFYLLAIPLVVLGGAVAMIVKAF